jgi:hypothetical protein
MDIDIKAGTALLVVTLAGFLVLWLNPPGSWLGRALGALQGGDCDCGEHRK